MHLRILAVATLALSAVAFAQPDDFFQVRYASNLNVGDSVINITNAGTVDGFDPAGRICVSVYTFDPAEELISCCSCVITPNGLNSLSARADLISNTLTPGVPTSIVVKLMARTLVGGSCNAASTLDNFAPGLRAWATTLHAQPTSPVSYTVTETEFSKAILSGTEFQKLTSYCGFIQAIGSGYGICRSCRSGGLGATKL